MDDLGTLGGTASTAHAVSSTGVVVGDSQVTGNTARHAFLYDGSLHDLKSLPGATNSFAHGVNGDGTVVGNTSSGHSFVWGSNRMFQLDRYVRPRGWTISDAASINEYGQIAATGFHSGGGGDRALILSPTGLVRPVKIADAGFDPAAINVRQGGVVQWVNNGPGTHSVADTSGLSLFGSGNLPSGVGFPFVFETAGRYPFQDIPRGLIGEVRVPVEAAPEFGDLSTTFQLLLAADEAPPNGVFDIRVKVPGATTYALYREGALRPRHHVHPRGRAQASTASSPGCETTRRASPPAGRPPPRSTSVPEADLTRLSRERPGGRRRRSRRPRGAPAAACRPGSAGGPRGCRRASSVTGVVRVR